MLPKKNKKAKQSIPHWDSCRSYESIQNLRAHSSFASNYWTYEPLAFCASHCLTDLDGEHSSFQENGLNEQPKAFSTVPYPERDGGQVSYFVRSRAFMSSGQRAALLCVLPSERTDCGLNFAMRHSASSNGDKSHHYISL